MMFRVEASSPSHVSNDIAVRNQDFAETWVLAVEMVPRTSFLDVTYLFTVGI